MTDGISDFVRLGAQVKPRVKPDTFGPPPKDEAVEQIFDQIFNLMRAELRGLTHHNPVIVTRGLSTLRGTYRILIGIDHHTDLYAPLLDDLEAGLNSVAIAARGRLLRQFLSPTSSPEQIELALQGLVELIDGGYWPNWQRDFNAALEECRRPN
jgi:hypothetical protein